VHDTPAAHLAGTDRAERLAESRRYWVRNEGVGSFQIAVLLDPDTPAPASGSATR